MGKPVLIGVRIDIETKSATDVKVGAYRYSEDPDFEVLVISYATLKQYPGGAVAMGKPRVLDLCDQAAVDRFASILIDTRFQKHAFNANFERVCLSRWMGMDTGNYIDPKNWHCSAVRANVNGVFGSLDEVARAVRSPIRKDAEGKRLIRLFSSPDRRTGRFHRFVEPGEPFEGRHCWCGIDHEKDSRKFGAYCANDVMTEAAVAATLPEPPVSVQREYEMDQRINDRGILHDAVIATAAVTAVATEKDRLMAELTRLTGLENPNSIQQMQGWLERNKYPMGSLDKAHREEALDDPMIPPLVARVLALKGAASLSSVAKHKAALTTRSNDGRIRGSLRFYGAHTGREAGRGIQPQNLPRYEAPAEDRALLVAGNAGARAPEIAKGSVRASLIPARKNRLVVVDYNAIEARVLGWLAGEQWVLDEFRTGEGKIYEATASTMFGLDKAALLAGLSFCGKCGKDSCTFCAARNKGKVSNLALGYNGGAGALVTMGAEGAGIDCGNYLDLHKAWEAAGKPGKFWEWNRDLHDYPELLRLRDLYRDSSPATTGFWKQCARAFDMASLGKGARFGDEQVLAMLRDGRHNRLVLPSGRSIWYRNAKSHADPKQPERIEYRTFVGKAAGVGHVRTETHGGKLTENVTQAVARDVLFDLMHRIERKIDKGYPAKPVLHVHDEVVLEVPKKQADQVLADVLGMMSKPPKWAPTLPVKGAGAVMERYGK